MAKKRTEKKAAKRTKALRSEVIHITVAKAKKWLEKQPPKVNGVEAHNRHISASVVTRYGRDMKNLQWEINGESIKFDEDGYLLDGQHRLMACVEARAPFDSLVQWNVPRDTFDTIDIGYTRTSGQIFGMQGIPSGNVVGAVCRLIFKHQATKGNLPAGTHINPTVREQEAVFARHPDVVDSVRAVAKCRHILSATRAAFLHWLFSRKDRDMADLFFDAIVTGSSLGARDPILHLRNRLLEAKITKGRMDINYLFAISIKAWNYTRSGKKVQVLTYKSTEKFPKVE